MTGINQVLKICSEIVNKARNVNNNDNNGQTVTMIDNKTVQAPRKEAGNMSNSFNSSLIKEKREVLSYVLRLTGRKAC
jgi:hypothetical protein